VLTYPVEKWLETPTRHFLRRRTPKGAPRIGIEASVGARFTVNLAPREGGAPQNAPGTRCI
jgi:hypothetical protein